MNNNENQNVNNNMNGQPVNNTNQTNNGGQTNQSEVDSGKVMAILSYFGILVLIPYFSEKNNSFVVFHAKQGLNLFILEIIVAFATSFISSFVYFFS